MQYEKNQKEEVKVVHNILKDNDKNMLIEIMLVEIN